MNKYPLIGKCLSVGIILLFISIAIIPSTGKNIEKSSSATRGHWLYVGGSGSGNYTQIRDAIDNATAGDTIYVYPGIYYETNLWVNKTLTLIGENQTRTIVDTRHGGGLIVAADQCNISGFTFQNSTSVLIWLSSDGNTISHNFFYIRNTGWEQARGLFLIGNSNTISNNSFLLQSPASSYAIFLQGQDNLIDHNWMRGWYAGIQDTAGSTNNVIRDCIIDINDNAVFIVGNHQHLMNNTITFNDYGIHIWYTKNNFLQGNTISHTRYTAVNLLDCENITFIGNNFSFNGETGLDLSHSFQCTISQNNFIENGVNAYVSIGLFDLFKRNTWSYNFWSDKNPTKRWYRVPADLELFAVLDAWITVPWLVFDRHPARQPYEIP